LAKSPPPTITNDGSDFWIVFRKEIYNKEDLSKLGLSERQIKAVLYVKEKGRITNSEYQTLNEISERTASRDLEDLFKKSILDRVGESKSTSYILKVGG
jgi:ATP-dependent DNA helicase RecG